MAVLGKVAASAISNENTLALANITFDFSLFKVDAPKEFSGLGRALTTQRRNAAEDGSLHKTARRLGALFEGIIPASPALINAYGRRVTEISALPQVNPKGTAADGVFAEHVGADGTSIWSAATSGSCAIAVHLLACMLARTFEASEATSILVELVQGRKEEIQKTSDGSHIRNITDSVVVAQDITRAQLASWDASARSWVLSVDEVKKYELTQLRLITNNIGLSMTTTSKTYRNVIDAWIAAMVALNDLICGKPQRVSNAAVLLGMSAWHIFPDLIVVGHANAHVEFRDQLVDPGGRITIGLQSSDPSNDDGVRWSLSLSHLRYYGEPVSVSKSTNIDGTRITIEELRMVALGTTIATWGNYVSDVYVAARLLSTIWDCIEKDLRQRRHHPHRCAWLWPVVCAAKDLLSSEVGSSRDHALMLIGLGRRRGRTFLGPTNSSLNPLFGLSDPVFLSSFTNFSICHEDRAIAILRNLAEVAGLHANECIIKYKHLDGPVEFATALQQVGELDTSSKRDRQGNKISRITHKRWIPMEYSKDQGCSCIFDCVKEDAGMCSCPSGQPRCSCNSKITRCKCRREGRLCSLNCRHKCSFPSYDCGNFSTRRSQIEHRAEVCYWLLQPQVAIPLVGSRFASSALPPSFGRGNIPQKYSSTTFRERAPPVLKASDFPYSHFDDAYRNEFDETMSSFCDMTKTDMDYSDETVEEVRGIDFEYFAGDMTSAALFTISGAKRNSSSTLDPEAIIEQVRSGHFKARKLMTYLCDLELGGPYDSYIKSLYGLILASDIYENLSGATIATSVIYQPLCDAHWILRDYRDSTSTMCPLHKLSDSEGGSAGGLRERNDDTRSPSRSSGFQDLSESEDDQQAEGLRNILSDPVGISKAGLELRNDGTRSPSGFSGFQDLADSEDDPQARGVRKIRGYHVRSYAAKFACIAMMELGSWNTDPKGLRSVMAMSSGNSIFVASQVLQDPYKEDQAFGIKRIIGNVGRAGVAILVPPQESLVRPLSDMWKLVQHKEYDGKAEDCFGGTSLHLSFTGHELPVVVKSSGSVDSKVNLVETLVSVHDHGAWVADVDILRSLRSGNLYRFDHEIRCEHQEHATRTRKTRNNQRLTSIDNWDELFDEPLDLGHGNVVVFRAHKNWLARLAAACICIQKGYRTAILSKEPLCQRCLGDQFRASHICIL